MCVIDSYLSIIVGQRRRVAGTLEHEEHPDLVCGSRERRSPDVAIEEDQVGGGGVFGLARQRALVDRAAVRHEPLLTRVHVALETVRQQNLLESRTYTKETYLSVIMSHDIITERDSTGGNAIVSV